MKKMMMFCLLLAFAVQACNEEDPYEDTQDLLERQDAQIQEHLADQGLEAEKDQYGVYRIPLQENASGSAIQDGDVARITYTLSQLDGTLIGTAEESMRLGFNRQLFLTSDKYLPYYLYNIHAHMLEGERYRFYLPFQYAYGRYALNGVIPAQSIVVLEVEVHELYKTKNALFAADVDSIESIISAAGEDADTLSTGVRKLLVEAGEGAQPVTGDKVTVYYTGKLLDGTVFDSNTGASQSALSFELGKGKVIPGFETAVKSMNEGETAVFYLPSAEAYGNEGFYIMPKVLRTELAKNPNNGVVKIPPHSPLIFELELEKVTK